MAATSEAVSTVHIVLYGWSRTRMSQGRDDPLCPGHKVVTSCSKAGQKVITGWSRDYTWQYCRHLSSTSGSSPDTMETFSCTGKLRMTTFSNVQNIFYLLSYSFQYYFQNCYIAIIYYILVIFCTRNI